MHATIHLILGGARSGKSKRAEEIVRSSDASAVYIATCATDGLDDEMRERIASHVAGRPAGWRTIENRFDLASIIMENAASPMLLDCLTLWIAFRQNEGERAVLGELENALRHARERQAQMVIVSNELGMGLVPLGAENRAFRDLCGRANQLVAQHADTVEFMIAGLPMKLK